MCREVSDNQLIEYIDNAADSWVAAHVVQCATCRERVAMWSQAQDNLRLILNADSCPAEADLGEYYLDTLDLERGFDISLHLQSCHACQQRLNVLGQFVDSVAQPRQILYPYLGAATTTQIWTVRDASAPQANEFTYRLEEAEVNLSIQDGVADQHTIWGLVTGIESDALVSAELVPSGASDSLRKTSVNTLGDFVLTDIPSGKYELLLNSSEIAYVLRGIQL